MARAKSRPSRPQRPPSNPPARSPYEGDESGLVIMGRVVGPFGVQGWVRIKPFTEDPAGLDDYAQWIVRSREGWVGVTLEDFELHAKGPVAKLAGCDDRDAALQLRGCEVAIPREALGETEAGVHYQVDLVGLDVVDEGGTLLGRVEGFFDAGDAAVMVVVGTRERMIPFVPEYVKSVDRGARRVTVDWKADYDA